MQKAPSPNVIPYVILQIGFGSLISFSSYLLAIKAHIVPLIIPNSNGSMFDFLPPEVTMEIILLIFGLAVVYCSVYLRKSHIKLSGWQLIVGAIIVAISALLVLGVLLLKQRGILGLYYTDVLFGLGLIVAVLGFIQLILRLLGNLEASEKEKIVESKYAVRGLRRRRVI